MKRGHLVVGLGLLALAAVGACSGRSHPLLYMADVVVGAAVIFTARKDEA